MGPSFHSLPGRIISNLQKTLDFISLEYVGMLKQDGYMGILKLKCLESASTWKRFTETSEIGAAPANLPQKKKKKLHFSCHL